MQKLIPNKTGLWFTTSLVVIGALFYAMSFFILQDRVLTKQIQNNLRKTLKKNGLTIEIENIHWSGWGSFRCSSVLLIDSRGKDTPISAEQVNIKFNLLALLKNRRSPMNALREVELVNPLLKLRRFSDGTWDIQKYFPKSKRKLRLEALFIVKNGTVLLNDDCYGKHSLENITGKAWFYRNNTLEWDCIGVSDLNNDFQWSSRGNALTNFKSGTGEVTVTNLLLSKIAPYLPEKYSINIYGGVGKFDLKFGWRKGRLWFEKGMVALNNTRLRIPTTSETINIKELDGAISPSELKIKSSLIIYNGSLLNISGQIDTKATTLKGIISGERVNLADLSKFIPDLSPYQLDGLANLKIDIAGDLDQPILNGELSIVGGGLDLKDDLRLSKIFGQVKIIKNNIEIKRLHGLLGTAKINLAGKVDNLFAPVFDLSIVGSGINHTEFDLPNLAGIEIGSKIDFKGKIQGELWNPKVTGDFQIDRVEYQDVKVENLTASIGWDVMAKDIQISRLSGIIGTGSFSALGLVRINSEGAVWKISGDISNVNLGQIKYVSGLGINGQVSTHAILKGKWKPGEPFEPGIILGTFKGESLSREDIYLKNIQGVYSWEQGKLIIDSLQARSGQGRIYGHLAWDTQKFTANFNAEHIQIRDFLPNTAKYPINGVFDGVFEFNGSLPEIDGKIQCSVKQITYLSKPIGELTGSFEYKDQGINIVDLRLVADSGDYTLKGRVDLGTEPSIYLTVNSFLAELDGFGEWLPVDPSLQLGGTGTLNFEISGPIANPSYTGLINLVDPSIGAFKMEEGLVKFGGDLHEISINQMELKDHGSSVKISGRANRNKLDLNFKCDQIRLNDFNLNYKGNRLEGRFSLEGELTGRPDNPTLSAEISSDTVAFGPITGNIKSGSIIWKEQEIQLSRIKLNGEDLDLNIYGKIGISHPLTFDLGINVDYIGLPKLIQVFKLSDIDMTGKVGGLVKITGDLSRPEIKVHGELMNCTLSSIPVQGEFGMSYRQNRLHIEQIKINQQLGNLVVSGFWDSGSALNLKIKAAAFSLDMFNSFLGPYHNLAGNIDIDAELQWSETGISGDLNSNIDELYLNQIRFGDLQLRGNFTKQGLLIDDGFLNTKGGYLTARGYLPWPDQILSGMGLLINSKGDSRKLDLELTLKNTQFVMINSYLPQGILATSGEMDGNLYLRGTYEKPIINGQLGVSNVGVTTSVLPLPVENAKIDLKIDNNRALINEARGRYGNGKFTLSGETQLIGKEDQFKFNLNLNGSNLYYRNNYFDGFTNLNLNLSGTISDSKLAGEVRVFESKLGILKMTKNAPSDIKWNPSLNLRVTTGKGVRYRQVGLADITVQSALQIGGSFKNPLINGEALSNKGVLTLYGQTFKINKAKAVFDYAHGIKPYVDVDSSVLTAKNEVFLMVKGQIGGDLSINLYSYPALSEEDLFALLNWSELRGDKPFTVQGVADTNISFITDTMFGEVFYELRQALHLDYLYLERDYIQDEFRISAGDFVSDNLFLSYSRSVSDQPKEKWGLDYHLTSNLITGGAYSIEEGASWRLIYRFRF